MNTSENYFENVGFDLPEYCNDDGTIKEEFLPENHESPEEKIKPLRKGRSVKRSTQKVRIMTESSSEKSDYHVLLPSQLVCELKSFCALQGFTLATLIRTFLQKYYSDNKSLIDMHVKPFLKKQTDE